MRLRLDRLDSEGYFTTQSLLAISYITYKTGQKAHVREIKDNPEYNEFAIKGTQEIIDAHRDYYKKVDKKKGFKVDPEDSEDFERVVQEYKKQLRCFRELQVVM